MINSSFGPLMSLEAWKESLDWSEITLSSFEPCATILVDLRLLKRDGKIDAEATIPPKIE